MKRIFYHVVECGMLKPMHLDFKKIPKFWKISGLIVIGLLLLWHIISGVLYRQLQATYESQASEIIYDRSGEVIQIKPNEKGYYNQPLETIPETFKKLLIKKEDQLFYFHFGLNPYSVLREIWTRATGGKRAGSSTLSQQLVKTLLGNEQDRNFKNKFKELFYALSLEWRLSKDEILAMYASSAYFGRQTQGLKEASQYYFNTKLENLSPAQILSLIASLNSPSVSAPLTEQNLNRIKLLAEKLNVEISDHELENLKAFKENQTPRRTDTAFEISSLNTPCEKICELTVDAKLTENIRAILKRNLTSSALDTAQNGAVVVIKLPENELLSMVGSPNPDSNSEGAKLNMAIKPRAVGSTAKPFIYLKGFEKGLRPYTLVADEEIKYQIGTGFDFFPKNFDGQYRGIMPLHQALSNSLNIPSVQVLEFVGLNDFYKFFYEDLGFNPEQPLENYELGIALGGLESDLTTWSHYFTLFPNQGLLKPLKICKEGCANTPFLKTPMAKNITGAKQVGKSAETELVNKILNDREASVEQFGLKSNLNLPFTNYALKTGTSRDYYDSWTLGYSPDFLVGVWVGNSDNTAMKEITGLSGAGVIWREVMLVLYNSSYNHNTAFNFDAIEEFNQSGSIEYGLKNDDYNAARELLLKNNLILSPHEGDKFLLQKNALVPLSAREDVTWSVNGKFYGRGQKALFSIKATGTYTIEAESPSGKKEQITIFINRE